MTRHHIYKQDKSTSACEYSDSIQQLAYFLKSKENIKTSALHIGAKAFPINGALDEARGKQASSPPFSRLQLIFDLLASHGLKCFVLPGLPAIGCNDLCNQFVHLSAYEERLPEP